MVGAGRKGMVVFLLLITFMSGYFVGAYTPTEAPDGGQYISEDFAPSGIIGKEDITVGNNKLNVAFDAPIYFMKPDNNSNNTMSMQPFMNERSFLVIAETAPEEIQKGDLVVFKLENRDYDVVHMAYEFGEDENGPYIVTKGINNYYAEKTYYDSVVGKVTAILYGGRNDETK